MNTKGFAETNSNIETPNDISVTGKPLNTDQISPGRVDINILKAKLEQKESKQLKKNVLILSSLILGLGILGVVLTI